MHRLNQNQSGFIPMMLVILFIIIAVLYFTFKQVAKAQQ